MTPAEAKAMMPPRLARTSGLEDGACPHPVPEREERLTERMIHHAPSDRAAVARSRPALARPLTAEKNTHHKAASRFNIPTTVSMRRLKLRSGLMLAALLAPLMLVSPGLGMAPALADLRLCNKTNNRVGVSIGYKDKKTWTTEGWWNIPVNSCETLVSGTLVSRFYYVYAVDYDHGGEWSGKYVMCTKDKMFTIDGTEDCVARGYNRSGFFEVDTGEQTNWTIQLNEPAQSGAKTQ